MAINNEKTAEIALAIVSLGILEDKYGARAWKALDWDVQAQLYQRGWVHDPVGKSKTFSLTPEGVQAAKTLQKKYLHSPESDLRDLVALEEGMWLPETRLEESWLKDRLHPDFMEVGRSGRVYRYQDMFPITVSEIICELPLSNLKIVNIASESVLITYDSRQTIGNEIVAAHRSSIWVTDGNFWRMRYHQGTPFTVAELH